MNSYVNMGVGALLGTVFVLMSVSIASEGIFHSEAPEKEGFTIVAEEAAGGEAAGGGEEAKGTPIATLLASADAAAGETVFKKCASCHTPEKGGPNKVGPNLWDIVNRPIAAHEGFSYSAGMTTFSEGHKIVWDFDHLNFFLEAPKKHVPGTAMGFAGLKKEDERANLIAYLRTLSDNPAALPTASSEGADAGAAATTEGGAAATEAAAPAEGATTTEGGAAATTTEGATAPAEGGAAATTTEGAAPAEGGAATTTEGAAPAEGATQGTTAEQPAAQ